MNEKAPALRLADWLDHHGEKTTHGKAAAELRRLHEVEQQRNELLAALKLALNAHGVMLMSDPPKDAWRAYGVEQTARAAIAKAEGEK